MPGTTGAVAQRKRPPSSGNAMAARRQPPNLMPFTTMSSPRADGVSFVVPVRNGALWLTHVLQSVLAQRVERPLEVVIVEDGSSDGSGELAARSSAADPRVSV